MVVYKIINSAVSYIILIKIYKFITDEKTLENNNFRAMLTSIPATLRKIFPQLGGPLTKRDAWAATFEHLLTEEYRDDCLAKLPIVPPPPEGELERQLELPIDEHANGLISVMCDLVEHDSEGEECGEGISTYRDFSPWVVSMWRKWWGT